MEEVPHRPIIDLKAALGELGDETAYGEVFLSGPPQKPNAVLTGDRLRLVAAHFPEAGSPRVWRDLQRAYFGTLFAACMNSMNARNLLGMWARFA